MYSKGKNIDPLSARDLIGVIVPLLLIVACYDDREIPKLKKDTIDQPAFALNEVVYTGSEQTNEFGEAADWLEVVVRKDSSWVLPDSTLFVSDNPDEPLKYPIPSMWLKANHHLVIWCDNHDTLVQCVHSNFRLSSSEETILLSLNTDSGIVVIDEFTYPTDLQDGMSYGRIPDEDGDWRILDIPTPGSQN